MKVAIGVVVVAAAAAVWHFRDNALISQATALLRSPTAAGTSGSPGLEGSALRKCLLNGQPIYTNGTCPAGSREQALTGGSLSVVPAAPRPASAAGPQIGHARDLLLKPGPPGEPDLKAKRIEAIVGE